MPHADPKPPPRCESCGMRSADVRRDRVTELVQCNKCWFSTDPARYGKPR